MDVNRYKWEVHFEAKDVYYLSETVVSSSVQ